MPPQRSAKARKKKRQASGSGALPPPPRWRWWLVRAIAAYLAFNLAVNLFLVVSAPLDLKRLLTVGSLDQRSQAAYLLMRHLAWHSSWEAELTLEAMAIEAAEEVKLDPRLLMALIEAESTWQPHAVSGVGACGLTQLMPSTARELKLVDPFDPRENLSGGARYLKRMLKMFNGDVKLALAAYNAGPGAVRRAGGIPNYGETRRYVVRITNRYQELKARKAH